jgi:hypothetical protein
VLFTFPSRYWFAIGHRGVLRLGGWSPHVQTGFPVPRPTRGRPATLARTGLSPALARLSRRFRFVAQSATGLVRVRSPLLAESLLMSFPPATEMVQFAGFASSSYGFTAGYRTNAVGCPIRRSEDPRALAPPLGFSQRATSFIASRCQGIHQMPFSRARPRPAPSARRAQAARRAVAPTCARRGHQAERRGQPKRLPAAV